MSVKPLSDKYPLRKIMIIAIDGKMAVSTI